METAIRTENLSKTFGSTKALVDLHLEVPAGEVIGYLGPNGAGKTTTIRLLLDLIRATRGRAEIFGVDCQADPVRAHRRIAYVPGEASLWPALTGTETLHLLGRVQETVDTGYQNLLIQRFELDPSKKVRERMSRWASLSFIGPSQPQKASTHPSRTRQAGEETLGPPRRTPPSRS